MVDLIVRKRDGGRLTREEVDAVIAGVTAASIPDYQLAALLMAIVWRGLDDEETGWLTDAMARSGGRADWSAVPGVKVGKHSTGGVGDKLTLVVVPLAAACGAIVPKSSGRGLGHTGGTVDKLEAIPGFRTSLPREELLAVVAAHGCAFVGQSADLAPADKTLYALRDVTGTVESLPLIASSIMSKKIAEGTDALVLDVKVGRGALMQEPDEARRLAALMVAIGRQVGLRTRAVLTAMDAPLGRAVGNAVEVAESIATLQGRGPEDVTELAVTLAAHMVAAGGIEPDEAAARRRVESALAAGAALDRFRDVVVRQGGDPSVVDDPSRLPAPAARRVVAATRTGVVVGVDARRVGRAAMSLGAGRERLDSAIDHGAGILLHVSPGSPVRAGDPLAELLVGAGREAALAERLVAEAVEIGDAAPPAAPLVHGVVR
jgi:pyrimidine-nucleoside phosphorylase